MVDLGQDQAARVLGAISRWLDANPGRSLRLTRLEGCWTASLVEDNSAMSTHSALDCLAQLSVFAAFEAPAGGDHG